MRMKAFGLILDLRSDDPTLLDAASKWFPYGFSITGQTWGRTFGTFELFAYVDGKGYRLRREGRTIFTGATLDALLGKLHGELMIYAGSRALDRVFVHAGVVGWRGRAIVMPGDSFAGKSTLVAAMVKLGATYYSDDYALVEINGMVHPYARPLQLRTPGCVEQTSVPVESLGGVAGTEPLKVAQVLFTKYKGVAEWRPRPVSSGEAVLQMLRHTLSVRLTPAVAMRSLTHMMAGAEAFRSPRGEADVAARRMIDALGL